ncbi:DUF748 domain-containing protein [Anaeromyxobacter sp. Fw109-5]|uniref:DUF748 domain-containing protein n=1 Tax=Anaeromyxobacter sp. (strain Fw109-5) TaxID=404589 RepID=UPI0002E71658|nr:DUF748 domain-containing protein [Anaeromyxobacter sp. Fw109-5]
MAAPTPTPPRKRRLVRVAVTLLALFAVYTALGFLAAPALLRRVLVKEGSAALHRDVTVAKVRVNPLALSLTIEGLAVKHRDGAPFAGWESLYVRLAPHRLVLGELGLAEIRLVRPSLHVGLAADGALTFQDLLEPEGQPAAAPPPPGEAQGGPRVSIGRLAVEEASVTFRDATRRPAFDTLLGPLTVRLESFRTRGGGDSPYAFAGTTESGETFRWTGTVRTEPLRSAGTLAFEGIQLPKYAPYLQDQLPADLHDGRLDFETRYELEWGAARRVLALAGGRLTVDRLAMGPRGVPDPAVKLSRIEVTGIDVDALAQRAKVAAVALRGGRVRVLREPGGELELERMAPPPSPPSPWRWSVGALAVTGLAVELEDRTPARPVVLPLTEVQLRLEQLRPDVDATWPLALSLVWNGRGRLSVKGPVQPFASKGTLELDAVDLDLAPLQPYLEPDVTARLTGGRAGAKARVELDASGEAPRWKFAGDVRLDGLSVAERGNEDLLRWRALEVSGIDAASTPPRASVRLVRLVEPRVKAYLWEDGATSFERALRAPPPPARPAAPARAAAAPEWRTAIGAVQVVRGRASFVDRSVSPPALVNVTGADASVTRLSSDPRVRSTVDVKLQVEGASPVRVAGTLNPLQKEAYTQLTVASQGVDLSPLGTYAGKFLGYGIQKGKLDLDLRYTIERRKLTSTNVVKVNQFTLGEATNSPDATKIPVRLALALLQDRNGVILLDVPVEGDLDDPEFHLGKVIWRTVLNVLVKVAASPFSALAALAGGDSADLSLLEFTPGTADAPAAGERLGMLARSLAERPALGLELEGSADPEQDGPALRRAALERSLRRAKAAAMRPPPPSLDEVTLTADERGRLVRAAHAAAFPPAGRKPGEAAPPQPSQQEMEERLAAAEEVPLDAYRSLAAERAQRAREVLLAAGVDQARLFLTQGGERAGREKGARVYFTAR